MKLQKPNTTRILFLITIGSLLFLYLMILVASNGKLAGLDFYYLASNSNHSIVQAALNDSQTGNTPLIPALLIHTFLKIFPINWAASLFFLLNLIVWITALYSLINHLAQLQIIRLRTRRFTSRFIASLFLFSAIFYQTLNIDEIWFWLSSTPVYSLSMAFAILGFTLLHRALANPVNYWVVGFSFFYLGSSNKPLAVLLLLVLMVYAGYMYFKKAKRQKVLLSTGIAFFSCLLAFILFYWGKETQSRTEIHMGNSMILALKMTGMIGFKNVAHLFLYSFGFGLALQYYLVKHEKRITKKVLYKKLMAALLIYITMVYLQHLLFLLFSKYETAQSVLFPTTVYTLIFSTFCINALLNFLQLKPTIKRMVFIFCFGGIIGLNTFHLIQQHFILTSYTSAYQERLNYLIANRQNQILLKVNTLPDSGWIKSAEISTNPQNQSNQHLKAGLKLKTDVAVIK